MDITKSVGPRMGKTLSGPPETRSISPDLYDRPPMGGFHPIGSLMMRTNGWPCHAARALTLVVAVGTLVNVVPRVEAEPARQASACDPARFKIALDVGHTAENPGATSARGVK